jgi:hypothetical protein
MKATQWILSATVIAAVSGQFGLRNYAGLFKIDFGQLENERIPLDDNGDPTGPAPAPLKDWNVIPTWLFTDPNSQVVTNSASLVGTASPDGTSVTWQLTDFSVGGHNTNVTLTIMDNTNLVAANSLAPALGMTANNPTKEGFDVEYDGIVVPHVVKDDYLYRNPCPAGSEMLFRFANIDPGTYNITVFMGRTTDTDGEFGKVWVDDINGTKEPATQNTGDFGGLNLTNMEVLTLGQPRTVPVTIKKGDYLWFGYMEDSSGGISGMIINPVTPVTPPPSSTGLFKIDFGQLENERVPVDSGGNPSGPAPDPLKDWNVIPTWTFDNPNANVVAGGASINGTANADGTAVTWQLTDFSNAKNTNVTMTIMDNADLVNANSLAPALGMTANNPTKEELDVVYDGVAVPREVKDDYLYRNPCPAGSEMLFRFANLAAGSYNVTVFMGRTSDNDGEFGKIWVDDINGKKEPATQNTGDFGSQDRSGTNNIPIPTGQPRTVTVTVKQGDYLWFGYMEDSTGGIGGMIIRGITSSATGGAPTLSFAPNADGSVTLTYTGTLYSSDTINSKFIPLAGATSPYKITPKTSGKAASFFESGP